MNDDRIDQDAIDDARDQGDGEAVDHTGLTGEIEALRDETAEPADGLASQDASGDESANAEAMDAPEERSDDTSHETPWSEDDADSVETHIPFSTEYLPDGQPPEEDGSSLPGDTGVFAPLLPEVEDLPRSVDLGPEKRKKWWIWIAVALVVLLAAGGGGYGWWWYTLRPVIVPDIVGKRGVEATQVLNDVDLTIGAVSEVPTDTAPMGTVLSQEPEAGAEAKPGGSVDFVIAAVPEQTKIPDVSSLSGDDAVRTLARARLGAFVIESHSETVAAEYVISQLPSAGVEAQPGTSVAVVVSKGQGPVARSVPALTGMELVDAEALVVAQGFSPRVVRSIDPSTTAGVVIAQYPVKRTSAAAGSPVQILVSQGAATGGVTVPGVTGVARKDAEARIKEKKLKPQVRTVAHPTVAKGIVISQMPAANGRVSADGPVDLLVSRGPSDEGTVPSVVGTSSVGATETVTAKRFVPVLVDIETEAAAAGTVFAQWPPAETSLRLGFPVVCLVAQPPRP